MSLRLSFDVQYAVGTPGRRCAIGPRIFTAARRSDTVHSEVLNEDRLIYVDFPLSYTPGSAQKYPVAFLLDGDVLLPAAGTVQDYYSGGFTPDMIIIGISNAENRTRDLTPPKFIEAQSAVSSDPMAVAMTPNAVLEGGAPCFLDFIENELIPYVEANYPVTQFQNPDWPFVWRTLHLFALSRAPSLCSTITSLLIPA